MTAGTTEIRLPFLRARGGVGALAVITILLMLWRMLAWRAAGIDLGADEAYYWTWALRPDWGYYSKPPMVAWIIALTTQLFGDSELAVKSGALLLYPLSTAVIWAIGREHFDARTAWWAALLFVTMPGVAMSSVIISTDVPLLLFWAVALWGYLRAMSGRAQAWWVAGAALGLGLLSKYNMLLLAVAVSLHWLSDPRQRRHFANPLPYLAVVLALFLFLPNLLWNAAHGFPTWQHTGELAAGTRGHFRLGPPLAFVASQFAEFGPVAFALLLPALARRDGGDFALRSLRWLTALPLGLIVAQALWSHAYANWAAPAYVAGSLLLAALQVRAGRETALRWAVAVNLVLGAVLFHYQDVGRAFGWQPVRQSDLYFRARGWQALGDAVAERLRAHPDAGLLCEDRSLLAELIYYARPPHWRIWSPPGPPHSDYDLAAPLSRGDTGAFVYVSNRRETDPVLARFVRVQRLDDIDVTPYPSLPMRYSVFLVEGFDAYER